MDDVDVANELAELNLATAIRNAVTAAPEAVSAGYCLSCFEDLKLGRWCDPSCRDDWERERAARRAPRNIKLPPEDDA